MKVIAITLVALCIVASCAAVQPAVSSFDKSAAPAKLEALSSTSQGVKVLEIKPLTKFTKGEYSWCPTCVNFFANAINQLLNIILNVGVLGECSELCSYLPTQLEATVCNLLCDIVGIEAFIKLIEEADPDPIYYCEKLGECGINPNAAGNITQASVQPASGPQGTTFVIGVVFQVTNKVATGELVFEIAPPDAQPFGTGELLNQVPPGVYQSGVKFQAKPSEQEPFDPGQYQVEVALCEGSCGSTHQWSKTLSVRKTSFAITQQ